MKSIIIVIVSVLLLIGCIEGEGTIFNPGAPKNGDVSFTINGLKYSSPLNWNVTLLNTVNPLHYVYELNIRDTLGFNFSQIMLLNRSGICGIVIPVEYNDPKYDPMYLRDEKDSCFVFRSDWEDGFILEIDTLAMFIIINGNFESKLINCKTNCGRDILNGRDFCDKYCDLEGTFSFEAKDGYDSSITVLDGKYIAYSRLIETY